MRLATSTVCAETRGSDPSSMQAARVDSLRGGCPVQTSGARDGSPRTRCRARHVLAHLGLGALAADGEQLHDAAVFFVLGIEGDAVVRMLDRAEERPVAARKHRSANLAARNAGEELLQ